MQSTNDSVNNLGLTSEDFLKGLKSRVSFFDAKLILQSAMVLSGVKSESDQKLSRESAKSLCLELIKRGGPAFQVGSKIYRDYNLH